MNHHEWVKWCFAGVAGKAKEILHIGVLSDLLNSLLVGQAKPLLDKECTKGQAYGLCRGASGGAELRSIGFFQLFPWHQGGEDPPAIAWVQRAAKKNMELLD